MKLVLEIADFSKRYREHLLMSMGSRGAAMNKQRLSDAMLVAGGFILSPLSWWNDLLVNVPLAYLFSWPFSVIDERLFVPCFILGYWLTNFLGLLMLHIGSAGLIKKQHADISVKHSIVVSIFYSVLMIIIVMLGWLESPAEYLKQYQ